MAPRGEREMMRRNNDSQLIVLGTVKSMGLLFGFLSLLCWKLSPGGKPERLWGPLVCLSFLRDHSLTFIA